RHAGNERLRPIDRIEHPDIFRVGSFLAEFLTNDAMVRERAANERAHCRFGRVVGSGDGIESARATLVLDAQRRAEEWQDGLARHRRELVDESGEVDRRHIAPLPATATRGSSYWHRFDLRRGLSDWARLGF